MRRLERGRMGGSAARLEDHAAVRPCSPHESRALGEALESAGVLVLVRDAEGRISHANRACESIAQRPLSALIGHCVWDLFLSPGDAERARDAFFRMISSGAPHRYEHDWLTPSGPRRLAWADSVAPPEEGRGPCVVGIGADVTRYRQSEANYRAIFDAANDAIFVHDTHTGEILDVNRRACELFGYTVEEMRQLDVGALSSGEPPYAQGDALRWITRAVEGEPQLFEWLSRDRAGRLFWTEVNLKRVTIGGKDRLLAIVRDISERKRALEALDVAHDRVLRAEIERKRFYREVIRAVTHDKLHLVDAAEIPTVGDVALEMPVGSLASHRSLRGRLKAIAMEVGMGPDRADDLVLAAAEAITNAAKHAGGGLCEVRVTPERVVVRVTDCGKGIQPEDIPASLLLPGFSTGVSLGMGYTIMLRVADALWLATGPDGTVVQIEKWTHPRPERETLLMGAWDRL